MALCNVQWSAKSIGKQVQMNVILPETGEGPFATFYLLHGLSDDYSMWERRTRIEMYVAEKPLIVVMPDGFRGFYTNNNEGPAYFDYMSQDLVSFVERNFPAKRSRSARCIGGLSMGGYGALRVGLGRPDLFGSVNSHSGALMRGSAAKVMDNAEFNRVFGKKPKGTEHDLLVLAERAMKAKQLPRLLIDCGTEDFLLDENRQFHAALEKMGVKHEYAEYPGAHNWDYWDLHIREAIAFHAKALKF